MKVNTVGLSGEIALTSGKSDSFEKLMSENQRLKSLLREQLLYLNVSLGTAANASELFYASTLARACVQRPLLGTDTLATEKNLQTGYQGVSVWSGCQAPCTSESCLDVSDSSSTEAPNTDDESEACMELSDEVGSNSGSIALLQRPLTVYMRNIPNRYSREKLLALFDSRGFKDHYRLVYLPMDFVTKVAKGYAFVCFGAHEEATRFLETFHGYRDWDFAGSTKVCEVVWSHEEQTVEEHVQRYRNCPLMHPSTPDVFRPALFAGGVRVPFPSPTQPLLKPRGPWNSRRSKQ